ncbi:MAG: ornithine carbamoyltransferase [Deltaproteobacteria bacterium]|nr:ornithine carbamoyltransferase [Deltaproteobacteria bacterium]
MKRDFLKLSDLTAVEIEGIWKRAREYKEGRVQDLPLEGKNIGLLFEKPSTRTRLSFEVAVVQTGGYPVFISSRDTQMARHEPLKDTARVLSRYLNGLVVRTFAQQTLEELAQYSTIPVINALSDLFHPAQILSDLFTIWERKDSLEGIKIAWLGDGNNVAHSWIEAAALFPFNLVLACPEGFAPNAEIFNRAGREAGKRIVLTRDPVEAVREALVINTDVWASMGQEDQAAERIKFFQPFQLGEKLLSLADPECLVMHCLPAHRGEEITDEVLEGPNSVVFDQAENKLHVHKALLEFIIEGREDFGAA